MAFLWDNSYLVRVMLDECDEASLWSLKQVNKLLYEVVNEMIEKLCEDSYHTKYQYMKKLCQHNRVISIRKFINKLEGASYLGGYSSMIYEVAKIINSSNISTNNLRLKMIKGTSEK